MRTTRFIPLGVALALMAAAGCEATIGTAPTPSPSASTKVKPKATATPKATPTPEATPTATPTPAATPSPSPSPTPTPSPSPSPSPTPTPAPTASPTPAATATPAASPGAEPPASPAAIAAATAFPFKEAGEKWTYKLAMKAGTFNLPGSLVLECQALTADGATVRTTYTIDTSKIPVGGGAGAKTIDKVQALKAAGGNPYVQILGVLFDEAGEAPLTTTEPVSTQVELTLGGTKHACVRQKFASTLKGSEVTFDLYRTADGSMVKQGAKGKKMPTSILPDAFASFASLGFDMTLELEKREKGGAGASPSPSPTPTPTPAP